MEKDSRGIDMSLFAGSLTTGNLFNDGLFNGGSFYSENEEIFHAPLTTTLVPFIGNFSPTFTRSTTASVTDFEEVFRVVKIGEARFFGARRIENLASFTEELDNAYYTPVYSTVGKDTVTDIKGELTADKLIEAIATNRHYLRRAFPVGQSNTYILSAYAKAGERRFINLSFNDSGNGKVGSFDLQNGILGAVQDAGITRDIKSLGNGWYRCIMTYTMSSSTTSPQNIDIYVTQTDTRAEIYTGDGVSGIYLWGFSLENVTDQSVKLIGEYVSSNVLSAPYHGTSADGVKYFYTTLGGTPIDSSVIKGYFAEGQRTNLALYSNDFSNAVWVKSNITPSSGTLTATVANGTLLQTVTSTSQVHTFSIQIKRKTGTGAIALTLDNGTTWTTKPITSAWDKYEVTQTLANPVFGIRISTSGDAIDVRYGQLETASYSSSDILTTSSSVTRNADNLKYLLPLPIDGTVYVEISTKNSDVNSGIVSKSLGIGPLNYNSDNGISFIDGTNTHVLTYGQPFSTGIRKIAARWSGSTGTMKLFKDGGSSADGAYAGTFHGGSEILIGQPNFFGCIRNLKIWNRVLSDAELIAITS